MTFDERLRFLIEEEAYQSCWPTLSPPSFNEFMEFVVLAFEKTLPIDADNLVVSICSFSEGRIGIQGSFVQNGHNFLVYGEVVWVNKHELFRGKVGYREKEEAILAPVDQSDVYELVSGTTRDLNAYGTKFWTSPLSLVFAFGPPLSSDEFKASGIYIFEGNRGSAFRINDYEETTLYWGEDRHGDYPTPEEHWMSGEDCEFRVAGNANPDVFLEWVKATILESSK